MVGAFAKRYALSKEEEGASSLEAAVVLPLICLLLVVVLQFAWSELSIITVESATTQALSSSEILSLENKSSHEKEKLIKEYILENSVGVNADKLKVGKVSFTETSSLESKALTNKAGSFTTLRSSKTDYTIKATIAYEAPQFINIGIPYKIVRSFSVVQHANGYVEVYEK